MPTSINPPLVLIGCMQLSVPPLGIARYAGRFWHILGNLGRLGFCYLGATKTLLSLQSLARVWMPTAGTIVEVRAVCCKQTSNPPGQTVHWIRCYGPNNNPEPSGDEPRSVCGCLYLTSFSAHQQRARPALVETFCRMPLPPSHLPISLLLRRCCIYS